MKSKRFPPRHGGSGFPDGKVLTAAHLVQTADEIRVELDDSKTAKAWFIASEPAADMALLQLKDPASGKAHARLGVNGQGPI